MIQIRWFFLVLLCFGLPLAQAAPFERVVTLSPLIAEWVVEIEGQKRAESNLVGVSEFSNYPEFLSHKPTIGPYPQIKVEAIAALKPDLVIASEEYNRVEQIEQLRRLKLNVQVLPREKFNEMHAWIRALGQVLHEEKKAIAAASRWTRSLKELRGMKGIRHRYFIEIQHEPLITVGGESFITEAFREIGFQNIFENLKAGYPKVSIEAVLTENPETIFILNHVGAGEDVEKSKRDWQRFKGLTAVAKQQIRTVSADDYARCSLRLLNALKKLKSVHAE
jgi:iron complex transport system substrate-binding protein